MIYLFLAVVFYSAALLIGTSAARNANTNLASAVNTIFSAVIPFLVVIPILSKKTFQNQKYGVLMAALSGIVVSLFVLAINKSLTQNKVSIVAPVIYGETILITTILSYFIFKEKLTVLEGSGLFFVLAGFAIIIFARATAK